MGTDVTTKEEFAAIDTIYQALEPLSDNTRLRIMNYVVSLLEITISPARGSQLAIGPMTPQDTIRVTEERAADPKRNTFAELFDAAAPGTTSEKALVAGYWLQVCGGADSFDGHRANSELRRLGFGLGNITNAVDALRSQRPARAVLLSKSGRSQRTRKTYKLTVSGIKAVEEMIRRKKVEEGAF